VIGTWSKTLPAEELLQKLTNLGVPAGKIYRAPDMLEDEQFKARDTIINVTNKTFGTLKMQGVFPRLSATPGSVRWTGPELGEHNAEVYSQLLDIDSAALDQLIADGTV